MGWNYLSIAKLQRCKNYFHIDEHRVRCYLIAVWRRGASGKNVPTHIYQYPVLAVKGIIEIWKSIYSNQTRWLFSTNMERRLACHRKCKTVPVLQHVRIYFQNTKYSSPVAGSVSVGQALQVQIKSIFNWSECKILHPIIMRLKLMTLCSMLPFC